jgi:hypothetical protein
MSYHMVYFWQLGFYVYILRQLGINLCIFLYILSFCHFGMLYHEKSGNPDKESSAIFSSFAEMFGRAPLNVRRVDRSCY